MAEEPARRNWFILAAGILAWVLGAISLLGAVAPFRSIPGWASLVLIIAGLVLATYGAVRERQRVAEVDKAAEVRRGKSRPLRWARGRDVSETGGTAV